MNTNPHVIGSEVAPSSLNYTSSGVLMNAPILGNGSANNVPFQHVAAPNAFYNPPPPQQQQGLGAMPTTMMMNGPANPSPNTVNASHFVTSPTNGISTSSSVSPTPPSTKNTASDASSCANVFVASLPNFYDDKMLLELFQPFGAIVSAKVSRDLVTGNSRSFGFVRFEHPDSAQRAIADLHNAKVKGAGTSKLHVVLSNHNENDPAAECDRLYVRNLPPSSTSETLVNIFSPYGTVLEANVHGNNTNNNNNLSSQRSGGNMAVGFVRMASVEEARLAMTKVHNTRPLDPDSPILVRFMETPDMKAARRGKNKDTENASGRNSANRNSPDHLNGSNSSNSVSPYGNAPSIGASAPPAYAPAPTHNTMGPAGAGGAMFGGTTTPVSPQGGGFMPSGGGGPMPIVGPMQAPVPIPPALLPNHAFPSYGDIYLAGAATEPIARFVFAHAGYTVTTIASNGPLAYFVRLADPMQHDRAAAELNNVVLSDGNTLRVVTLIPPQQHQQPPPPQQQPPFSNIGGMPIQQQQQQQQQQPMLMGGGGGYNGPSPMHHSGFQNNTNAFAPQNMGAPQQAMVGPPPMMAGGGASMPPPIQQQHQQHTGYQGMSGMPQHGGFHNGPMNGGFGGMGPAVGGGNAIPSMQQPSQPTCVFMGGGQQPIGGGMPLMR